jgi:hypothetical protein
MAGMHTVKQGEYMAFIAAEYGFTNWQTIWNLAQNAALKSQRQNPNVLFPGDQLYIPYRQQQTFNKPTDNTHSFKLKTSTLKLRLTLRDKYEKPIANAKCVLAVDGTTINVTTDAQGGINQDIPSTAQKGVLVILDAKQTPYNNIQIPILIGNLDPLTEVSGQQARLKNLGYFRGDVGSPADDAFEAAVEEFQCDHDLTVDGICGPATQAKLKEVHGC